MYIYIYICYDIIYYNIYYILTADAITGVRFTAAAVTAVLFTAAAVTAVLFTAAGFTAVLFTAAAVTAVPFTAADVTSHGQLFSLISHEPSVFPFDKYIIRIMLTQFGARHVMY